MAKTKVFAFINYKGGVAKTTSAYHIGCWLAGLKQKKVLFIDIDPQTNLTFLCASISDWKKRRSEVGTIREMYRRYLDGKPIDTRKYIWKAPIRLRDGRRHPRIDLVPCDIDLIGEDMSRGQIAGEFTSMAEVKKNAQRFIRDRRFLTNVIHETGSEYDYVLIDCPPNLYLMTENALVASDYYIVTAIPDHLSTIGLNTLIQKVNEIDSRVKDKIIQSARQTYTSRVAEFGAVLFVRVRIGGSVLTRAHSNIMYNVRSMLHNDFGTDKCFETYTTEAIGYTEAAEQSLPVWLHDSTNARRASDKQEYPSIVDEFLERF